jgi:hypothetical protein
MFKIKRKQPARVRRQGGIAHFTAESLCHDAITNDARRLQMSDDVKDDNAAAAADPADPNFAEYSHSTQIQKHLVPQSCVLVVLVKDLTRGGAVRAVLSGSPSMDPFALLDQLMAGVLMLTQAIRYAPEELKQQQSSLIVRPGQVDLPAFAQPRKS